MMPGETVIDDGVLQRGMISLKQLYETRDKGWPIMGWDIEDTYWIKTGIAGEMKRVEGSFKVYEFKTTETAPTAKDYSLWRSTMDQQVLCGDGKFRPLSDVTIGDIKIQHVRGNGHTVVIESAVLVGDAAEAYCFGVEGPDCFVHHGLIHKAGT